jgi:preprotein translocase subunit SecF
VLLWSLPFIHGLNFGVDFAGGTEIQVHFAEKPDLTKVDAALKAAGFGQETAQSFGPPEENSYIIRVGRIALMSPQDAERAKAGALADGRHPEAGGVPLRPRGRRQDRPDLHQGRARPTSSSKVLSDSGVKVSDVRSCRSSRRQDFD